MTAVCLHPGGLDFTEQLVQFAAMPVGASVLDAGCGAGKTVDWLQQQGFVAYGIDKEPQQLTMQICQGDLRQLPYADEQFTAVISECTAFICGDTAAMLRESYRVLQQDGWLLLADVFFDEQRVLPQFSDGRPVTMAQWQQLLEQNQFTIEKIEDVSAAWKPFVIEQLWAGRTLEELWGGCLADGQTSAAQYKPGYFLLWARKGAKSDGRTTGYDDADAGIDRTGICL